MQEKRAGEVGNLEKTPSPLRPFFPFVIVILLAIISAFFFFRGASGLPLDDAYIHLTFARNLAQGHGFGFNPGEFSLGFSSPLWVLLLALVHLTSLEAIRGARILGVVFHFLSLVMIYVLIRNSYHERRRKLERARGQTSSPAGFSVFLPGLPQTEAGGIFFGLLGALILAFSGNLLWLAGSGMETMLFLTLGLALILLFSSPSPRPLAGGLLLGLLLLTRAEGWVLFLLILLQAFLSMPFRKKILLALVVALVIAAPWFIFCLAKTGHLLPPTQAGKLASDLFNSGWAPLAMAQYLKNHVLYLFRSQLSLLILFLVGLISALMNKWFARTIYPPTASGSFSPLSSLQLLILWAIGNFVLHALFFRSTAIVTPYHNLRYQVMLLPAIVALSVLSLSNLAEYLLLFHYQRASRQGKIFSPPAVESFWLTHTLRALTASPWSFLIVAFLLLEAVVGSPLSYLSFQNYYQANVRQLSSEHLAAAKWAQENLPAASRVASLDIGILGYYSDRYVIDLGGLIDPEVHPYLKQHRTGPYLVKKKATHYFAMVRHDSERITGVKQDEGNLYHLRVLRRFDSPPYEQPVFLHSLGLMVYEVSPLPSHQ